MTALNLRKNLSNFLHATATVVDQAKVPELKSIGNTFDNVRLTIAKAVVPNDKAFIIPMNK